MNYTQMLAALVEGKTVRSYDIPDRPDLYLQTKVVPIYSVPGNGICASWIQHRFVLTANTERNRGMRFMPDTPYAFSQSEVSSTAWEIAL